MNLASLAAEPKLIKVTLDSPDLIAQFSPDGSPLEFYTLDIVSLSTYFEFFNKRQESDFDGLVKLCQTLILKEDGTPLLGPSQQLPPLIMTSAIAKVSETLGKSLGKTSTQTAEEPKV